MKKNKLYFQKLMILISSISLVPLLNAAQPTPTLKRSPTKHNNLSSIGANLPISRTTTYNHSTHICPSTHDVIYTGPRSAEIIDSFSEVPLFIQVAAGTYMCLDAIKFPQRVRDYLDIISRPSSSSEHKLNDTLLNATTALTIAALTSLIRK